MLPNRRDINAYVNPKYASASTTSTAGSEAPITGETIDRKGLESLSMALVGPVTLGATETVSISTEYQESSDGSTWDTAVALEANTLVVTDTGAGGTYDFEHKVGLTTYGLKRYVRINYTLNFSAGLTDNATLTGCAVMEAGPLR